MLKQVFEDRGKRAGRETMEIIIDELDPTPKKPLLWTMVRCGTSGRSAGPQPGILSSRPPPTRISALGSSPSRTC